MTHMFGIDIVMVMGVTDIDDKIIKRAKEVNHCIFHWLLKILVNVCTLTCACRMSNGLEPHVQV